MRTEDLRKNKKMKRKSTRVPGKTRAECGDLIKRVVLRGV